MPLKPRRCWHGNRSHWRAEPLQRKQQRPHDNSLFNIRSDLGCPPASTLVARLCYGTPQASHATELRNSRTPLSCFLIDDAAGLQAVALLPDRSLWTFICCCRAEVKCTQNQQRKPFHCKQSLLSMSGRPLFATSRCAFELCRSSARQASASEACDLALEGTLCRCRRLGPLPAAGDIGIAERLGFHTRQVPARCLFGQSFTATSAPSQQPRPKFALLGISGKAQRRAYRSRS